MAAGGDIAADHRSDRLGLLPADIALMDVRHQRQPFAPRLAADLHADTIGIVSRRHCRLTIGIGAAVDGVLDHPVDGGVVRPPPRDIAIALLHRQIEIMLVKPEQRLPCAPEFLDLGEDQPDSLLDAAVWILLITITRLDEPDRRADDEFATTGLLVARGERALAQQIKLILVEAALQSEQKPVIAMTRCID